MMARMLSQLPLPLLPAGAAEIAPGVGLLTGEAGGCPARNRIRLVTLICPELSGQRICG
jgi:hypothetical protein